MTNNNKTKKLRIEKQTKQEQNTLSDKILYEWININLMI